MAQREWSMVTGAVFATRRTVLERINGFDERFSLEFNDIDLCLRIRNLGYRLVYNPDAVFTHAEKISRGETIPPGEERALFLSRWSRWLENDPASHPRFARGGWIWWRNRKPGHGTHDGRTGKRARFRCP
ncbi:glycosyltransferase [Komagataeibacter rhaeticus]|nr:glycosyltransferase [Komagataeibacter rhaeticus]